MGTNTGKTPFQFSQAICLPFKMERGGVKFTLGAALFFAIVIGGLFALMGGPILSAIVRLLEPLTSLETTTQQSQKTELVVQVIMQMGYLLLPFIVIILGAWIAFAMIEAELHRRNLRHEGHSGIFPWRFGKDELRVMTCQLLIWLFVMIAFFLIYFIGLAMRSLALAAGSHSATIGIIVGLFIFIVIIVALSGLIFMIVRLSPATALSIEQRRITLWDIGGITKGRFWPSLGAYLLVGIIGYSVITMFQIIIMTIFLGSAFATIAADAMTLQIDTNTLQTIIDIFSKPGLLPSLVIVTFLTSISYAIWGLCLAGIWSYLVDLRQHDEGGISVTAIP